MFIAKTEKISGIAKDKQAVINQLNKILVGKTRVYIDYANVRPWSTKLGWHIDLKRLKQFLDSFDNINAISLYMGFFENDGISQNEKNEVEKYKYILRTKPIKIMKHSINFSSISVDSTALLNQFVRKALLRKYDLKTIEYLNRIFENFNSKGDYFIEDRKCNFDVEIGVDMLIDCERNNADTFILWSGDSDFADSVEKLMIAGKKVILFATARKVSVELSALTAKGLLIFDIKKIRDFICRNREMESKRDPIKGP